MIESEWEEFKRALPKDGTLVVTHRASFINPYEVRQTRMSPFFITKCGTKIYGRRTKRIHYRKIEHIAVQRAKG